MHQKGNADSTVGLRVFLYDPHNRYQIMDHTLVEWDQLKNKKFIGNDLKFQLFLREYATSISYIYFILCALLMCLGRIVSVQHGHLD